MYPQIKFGISISYISVHDLNRTEGRDQGHSDPKNSTLQSATPMCTQTRSLRFLRQIIQEICSGHDYPRTEAGGQGKGQTDSKNGTRHLATERCTHIPNLGILPLII